MHFTLSLSIFILAYIFIASEKINKTIVALFAALIAILFKAVNFHEAVSAIDFNVIFLLIGMMISVHILSKTGFFEWIAVKVAQLSKGEPIRILIVLILVTAVLSAFLDNVTTIILIVPVTILIAELLELNPIPFVVLEAISSNIGGTATLIGDPPNIIIGSSTGFSFNDFIINLTPVISIVVLFFVITLSAIFNKRFNVKPELKRRLLEALPERAIIDKKNMIKSLIVFAFIFLGFFLHALLHVEPGVIALFGSMVMLLFCKSNDDEVFTAAEWGVILFFIGMFMLIAALEVNGVIEFLGKSLIGFVGNNLLLACMAILWGAAILSAILDNIPFVIAMIPLIKDLKQHFIEIGINNTHDVDSLWWALALGACLGGNATLIGASANVVMAKISEKNGYKVSFIHYLKYGIPFTVESLIICSIYIWLRYFVL